jgi:hypothetical protein
MATTAQFLVFLLGIIELFAAAFGERAFAHVQIEARCLVTGCKWSVVGVVDSKKYLEFLAIIKFGIGRSLGVTKSSSHSMGGGFDGQGPINTLRSMANATGLN